MSVLDDPETEQLLIRTASNDDSARDQLFARHRPQLRRMVGIRMDDRLAVRVDPSDVVQEVLAQAARSLPEYLQTIKDFNSILHKINQYLAGLPAFH